MTSETIMAIRKNLADMERAIPRALSLEVRMGYTEGLREAIDEILHCQYKMLELLGTFLEDEVEEQALEREAQRLLEFPKKTGNRSD